MDRVQIKENAKAFMHADNNLSSMIGAELLSRFVLSGISSIVLTVSVAGVLRGVLNLLSGVVGGVRDALLSLIPYGVGEMLTELLPNVDFAQALSGMMSNTVANLGIVVFLVAPVNIGLARYFVHLIEKRKRPRVISVFDGFENYKNIVVVWISRWLRVSLLPWIIITVGTGMVVSMLIGFGLGGSISGIITSLLIWLVLWAVSVALKLYMWVKTWAMTWILAENMDVTTEEALEESARITEGHFWDLIVFEMSFWGWKILSSITFGLVGVFYVDPYYDMACALLYQDLKGKNIAVKPAYEEEFVLACKGLQNQVKKIGQKVHNLECSIEPKDKKSEIGILGVVGMYAGSMFPLEPGETVVIGRDQNVAQIVFVNGAEKISRRHCSVMFSSKDNKYRVIDYSSNGTYIGGNALPKNSPVLVERGSALALGNTNNVIRLL